MTKKVEVKKEVKKSEIKAKKVGKNLTVVIDGVKIVKPNITDKDLKSISSKILLYNKANSEARLKEIHKLLQGEISKEKEVKEVKEKTIKKIIKKASSKKSSTKVEEPIDLITEVRKAHANKEVTDEEIEALQDLINKKKEEKAKQEQENPTQKVVDNGSSTSRERYR